MVHLLCRMALACTFIFSGFVKIADPMGMTHKLHAYAVALGVQLQSDSILLQFFACAIGCVEFVLGIYLLLGVRRKLAVRIAFLVMLVFTAVTVWIYKANPVADCGCFGDAVHLTNGQTLAKNVVLLLCASMLQFYPMPLHRVISQRNAWVVSIYSWVYAAVLCVYTLHYLPTIDFTPYRTGGNIRAVLNGENMEDTGGESRLANFYLADIQTGDDKTFDIVNDSGYTFLLVVPDVKRADDGCSDRINDIYDVCQDMHYAFFMATASGEEDIAEWRDRTGAAYSALQAEDTELQTMVRSNPGLLLIKDGRIVAKWSNNALPEPDVIGPDADKWIPVERVNPLLALILWFLVPACLVVVADSLWIGSKYFKHHIYKKRLTQIKMRKKIVAGNWKMNKNLQEGISLAKELNEVLSADKPNCGVIICTPYIHLASVAGIIDSNIIGLGAENCADKEKGAYTGEVSAEMVKSTGANYVILGHSERRAYYHETPEILKEKVNLALANNLDVIFCIGEVLEEREAGKQNEVVKAQLEGSLFDLTAEQFSHIILAYEPVWAIGTGKTATSDQAQDMHAFIRATIAEKFGAEAAENVTILYGGSCKPSNAKELFSKVDVDGGLIGGAALKAADFKGIIDAWKA